MFRSSFVPVPPALGIALAIILCCGARGAAQTSPKSLDDYLNQARQLENAQDYAAAARVYEEAARAFPQQAEIQKRLGIVYQTQLRFAESISTFQKAGAPEYPEVNFYLGLSYFGVNQLDKAIESFEREIAANPTYRRARYYLAQVFLQLKRNSDALRQYEILLEQDPTDKRVIYQVIRFHKTATIEAINLMGNLDPDSDYMHALKADTLLSQEKFSEAIKEFNKVLERNPNFPGIHEALGELYHRKVDYPSAEREFRLALQEDPNHPTANYLLADILLKSNRVDEAVPLLEITIQSNPNSMMAHFQLGKCYFQQGKYQEAVRELNRAAELDPTYRSTHYVLADVYKRLNQPDKEEAHRAIFRKLYEEDRARQARERGRHLEEAAEELSTEEPAGEPK
jgi:tetratricopeptide (TPR) repeat protein